MIESIGSRLPMPPLAQPRAEGTPKQAVPGDSVVLGATPSLPKAPTFKAAPKADDGTQPPADPTPKKWTVMVWGAADNNLLPFEIHNIKDIETVGSTSDVNVVTQFDFGDPTGASRILLQKGSAPEGEIASPAVEQLGNVDMADPQTMSDFIQWSMTNYPAEHYMFIVNDHGDGWRGCIEDDSAGTFMTLPQLHAGLQNAQDATGTKIDVLGFDACLMAMGEVGYELKDNASFIVGSQQTEGAAGWRYSTILTTQLLTGLNEAIRKRLPVEPKDVAAAAVTSAQTTQDDLPTMSAFDLSKAEDLKSAMDVFAAEFTKDGSFDTSRMSDIYYNTQGFYDYSDLASFCQNVKDEPSSSDALKAAADGVLSAVSSMVIAEEHSSDYPNAHGVSIELGADLSGYGETQFAQNSQWTGVQAKIQSALSSAPAPGGDGDGGDGDDRLRAA